MQTSSIVYVFLCEHITDTYAVCCPLMLKSKDFRYDIFSWSVQWSQHVSVILIRIHFVTEDRYHLCFCKQNLKSILLGLLIYLKHIFPYVSVYPEHVSLCILFGFRNVNVMLNEINVIWHLTLMITVLYSVFTFDGVWCLHNNAMLLSSCSTVLVASKNILSNDLLVSGFV